MVCGCRIVLTLQTVCGALVFNTWQCSLTGQSLIKVVRQSSFMLTAMVALTCRPSCRCVCALQEKSLEDFDYLMRCALKAGMKKVVACCEFCIASDRIGKYNTVFSALPSSSTFRLARGMRQGIYTRGFWLPEDFLDQI